MRRARTYERARKSRKISSVSPLRTCRETHACTAAGWCWRCSTNLRTPKRTYSTSYTRFKNTSRAVGTNTRYRSTYHSRLNDVRAIHASLKTLLLDRGDDINAHLMKKKLVDGALIIIYLVRGTYLRFLLEQLDEQQRQTEIFISDRSHYCLLLLESTYPLASCYYK